jgi:hypothetical protein
VTTQGTKIVRQILWVQFVTAVQALAGAELPIEWKDPDAPRDVGSLNRLAAILKAQVKAGRVKKLDRGLYEVTWYDPPKLRDKRA